MTATLVTSNSKSVLSCIIIVITVFLLYNISSYTTFAAESR